MPQTLSSSDPNLLKAVQRLARSHYLWAALFIGFGLLTQFAAAPRHLFSGLPFIMIGMACLLRRDPALLAAVAVMFALSIVPMLNSQIGILGPDPLRQLTSLGALEFAALALGKLLLAYTAFNQFLYLRFLYGTAQAVTDEPNLPHIPEMVPNRTDAQARWARGLAIAGMLLALGSLFTTSVELETLIRAGAELGGSLGAVAIGLGLGAAFSPTGERPAALLGTGLGLLGYITAVFVLLRLP
jgi:hypothetical protein